jgi:Protein of unknown function (DUF3251)
MSRKLTGWIVLLFAIGVVAATAFSHDTQTAPATAPDSAQQDIQTLKNQVRKLVELARIQGEEDSGIASELKRHEDNINLYNSELTALCDGGAILDISDGGYAPAKTVAGVILISCADCEPYLDGYRLILKIGNPTNANFDGGSLHLQYGRKWDSNSDYSQWQKSLRAADFAFAASLEAGSWTNVPIVIRSVTSEGLAYLKVTIELNSLSLRQPTE